MTGLRFRATKALGEWVPDTVRDRLGALWKRFDRAAQRGLDLFPITPLGLLVVATAAAALYTIAYPTMDLVVLVLGWAAIALAAAATVLVVLGTIRVYFAARALPRGGEEKLETGRMLPTGVMLPSLLWVPMLRVWWEWETPTADVAVEPEGLLRLREEASLRVRGYVRGVRRRIVVEDVLGLSRLAFRHSDPIALTVLPHPGALREMPVLVSLSGGDEFPHPMGVDDGDRMEIRRYAPGDPARFIHWKVFGRTRKLMVRMPERALTRARRTVAYLVAGPRDEASAAAARVAIESGALGPDWVFGADGTPGEASEPGPALERVIRSVDVASAGGAGGALALKAFVERAERAGPASLVLFVPPEPGPWLDRVVQLLRARAGRSKVVIATDAVTTTRPRSLLQRLLLRAPERIGTSVEGLDKVTRAIAQTRVQMVVVDRHSGRRIGDAHRRAMAALARPEAA